MRHLPAERVVITGVGAVTAAVSGGAAAVGAYLADPRAVTPTIPAGTLATLIDGGEARRLSRACQLTVAAARLAVADAGMPDCTGVGLVVGSELGDLHSTLEFADGYLQRGPSGLSPLLFPNTVMNTMAAAAAIAVGAKELALTLNAPDVAGELALARAAHAVASGRVTMTLAGGVDQIEPTLAPVFTSLGAPAAPRGEGAVLLVLEARAHALARGARILGEIVSAAWRGAAARAHGVGRRPDTRAVARALAGAGVGRTDVAWVYDSASGDCARDGWEARVLAAALGPPLPPVASLAPFLGHSAALGALRVAAAAWTARSGLLPASPMRRVRGAVGLVHGLARGGTHVALVVGAGEGGGTA
ncbi:MAG TPA: beta-ketoacyl synthase N-terminal-like domain-containing protein [Methylomirabilota bacterium]|jgi:3-oxoacyl-[acyl-carrier-protein] synthase II